MKVINVRNRYDIQDDTLRTFDALPAGFYDVEFSQMTGFSLVKHQDITVNEKVYGKHLTKVEKVLTTFATMPRNLGVILSGKKGIGKSLFAKLVSIEAVKNGMPVILVSKYIPGIAAYIESIEQECVVMFDEYDKTFGGVKAAEGHADTQAEMLGLFDGMAQGKKLFVITCNDLYRLSEYLVNRPGRFHYHFRFDCPSEEEIREYLSDKVDEKYASEIDKVVAFSKKVDLNFDCLRSIAFELNRGEPFEVVILDLNIVNTETQTYDLELHFAGGYKLKNSNEDIDLFDTDGECSVTMYDERGRYVLDVRFDVLDTQYDMRGVVVRGDKLTLSGFNKHESMQETVAAIKATKPEYLLLKKRGGNKLHYLV